MGSMFDWLTSDMGGASVVEFGVAFIEARKQPNNTTAIGSSMGIHSGVIVQSCVLKLILLHRFR